MGEKVAKPTRQWPRAGVAVNGVKPAAAKAPRSPSQRLPFRSNLQHLPPALLPAIPYSDFLLPLTSQVHPLSRPLGTPIVFMPLPLARERASIHDSHYDCSRMW